MTYDEWQNTYLPLTEPFGPRAKILEAVDPHFIWTVTRADPNCAESGNMATVMLSGKRTPAMSYVLTASPWTEDVTVEMPEDDDDDGDEDDDEVRW